MAVNIKAPDVQAFGAYGPAYAATLSRRSQNNGANILNQLALKMLAQQEQGSYLEGVNGANEMALRGADIEQRGGLAKTVAEHFGETAGKGVGQSYLDLVAPGVGGYLNVDGPGAALRQSDNVYLDNQLADSELKRSGVVENLNKADVGMAPEDVGAFVAGPTTPLDTNRYIDFGKNTDRIQADASMVSAHKPPASSGDGGPRVVTTYGPDGKLIQTTVTDKHGDVPAVINPPANKLPPAQYQQMIDQYKKSGASVRIQGKKAVITATSGKYKGKTLTIESE